MRGIRTIGYGGLSMLTGLSRRTLERYRADGRIPPAAVVKYARAVRFRVDLIEQWITEQREGAKP